MQEHTASAARDETPAPPAMPARPRTLTAIGLMCLAVICFSCLDASGKFLVTVGGLPTAEAGGASNPGAGRHTGDASTQARLDQLENEVAQLQAQLKHLLCELGLSPLGQP